MLWPQRKKNTANQASQVPPLAFPYYVDNTGIRGLADSLGIDLPTVRERSSEKRLTLRARGVGGERGWHDTSQSEGHIHLNHLAARLKRSSAYRDVVDVLGLIPQVHDRGILRAAISHFEYMPSEGTGDDDLSGRLRSAYEAERTREIALAKREELKQVAMQNQLVILRGTFETIVTDNAEGRVRVKLTHLEPSEVIYERLDTPESEIDSEATEMLMPDEVGIEAVLPAVEAFTAAGRERLSRGAPFYGRLIGHSASFDESRGVLTCSAYAVWGMTRPASLLARPQHYEFLEGQ